MVGGWSINGIFNHWSGAPFTVSASASSCNCPGNSQTADLVKSSVSKVGRGVGGEAYFDPTAYRPVTGARFGTSGFNQLRGPGNDNLDMSIFRSFLLTEKAKLQFRAEALNLSNTAHFANPGANVSNASFNADGTVRSLGGFSQITTTNPLGRTIDQRYLRFGLRLTF